jgi:hypothetical protein
MGTSSITIVVFCYAFYMCVPTCFISKYVTVNTDLFNFSQNIYITSQLLAHCDYNSSHALIQIAALLSQTSTLQHFTGYSELYLRECVTELHGIMAGSVSSQLQAVRKKYSSPKFNEVTKVVLPSL